MKKNIFLIVVLLFCLNNLFGQYNVGINPTGALPDASAALDVVSRDKGILIPRLSYQQKWAIPLPATGLLVFDTDSSKYSYWDGTTWTYIFGPMGPQGPAGPTGDKGEMPAYSWNGTQLRFQNPDGTWGVYVDLKGIQGDIGPTGADGPQGIQGPSGLDGATGAQGPAGADGATGAQGPTGAVGATGAQGPTGTAGATGAQGPTGTAGATGAQGPTGTAGATGAQGPTGTAGATGAQGPTGTAGATGAQGSTGTAGADGAMGVTGVTGPAPAHQWLTTQLRFQNPDSTWGAYVDLIGPEGPVGGGGGGGATLTRGLGLTGLNYNGDTARTWAVDFAGTGSANTVSRSDHTHAQLHDRLHAMTSTSDHTAGNWKLFYSNGSGQVQEMGMGTAGQILTGNGAALAPTWTDGTFWNLTGNAGTTAGTNFLGTTDAKDFVIKTNNVERMRVMSTGQVVVNKTSATAGYMLSSYASTATGIAVYGENTSTTGDAVGVNGVTKSATGSGVYGLHDNTIGQGFGVAGISNSSEGIGVYAEGRFFGVYATLPSDGVQLGAAIQGSNMHINGVGVVGTGNGLVGIIPEKGSGGVFVGKEVGAYGLSKENKGIGIVGVGNGINAQVSIPTNSLNIGAGGFFVGSKTGSISESNNEGMGAIGIGAIGVYGYSTSNSVSPPTIAYSGIYGDEPINSNNWAGYFNSDVNINGGLYINGAFVTSDVRLKNNIEDISSSLNIVMQIEGKRYSKICKRNPVLNSEKSLTEQGNGMETRKMEFGVIAQDLEKILPDLITERVLYVDDTTAYKAVNYIGLIPILIEATKEQQKEIESQQEKIDLLIKQNAELLKRLEQIEQQR